MCAAMYQATRSSCFDELSMGVFLAVLTLSLSKGEASSNFGIKVRQRLFRAHMLADHQLGGVTQFMAILAFTGLLGEKPRRLRDGGEAQSAGSAHHVLGQPRRIVPFFVGAGRR